MKSHPDLPSCPTCSEEGIDLTADAMGADLGPGWGPPPAPKAAHELMHVYAKAPGDQQQQARWERGADVSTRFAGGRLALVQPALGMDPARLFAALVCGWERLPALARELGCGVKA